MVGVGVGVEGGAVRVGVAVCAGVSDGARAGVGELGASVELTPGDKGCVAVGCAGACGVVVDVAAGASVDVAVGFGVGDG
jgi:hypothetical protein